MNRFRATALVVVLLASGCAGWSSSTTARPVHTHGVLVRVGGPAPGAPVALSGVRLHFAGKGGSADVRTDHHGGFSVDLAPGTYRVTVTSGGPQSGNHSIQPFPKIIQVPHSGRLRLVVSIR
jgi:hypothetical protein